MNGTMIEQALALYKVFGREYVKRWLTPPRRVVEQACKKSGANLEKALEERNEYAEELLEFLESMVDVNFQDPD